jgi:hypothetical protein
MDENISTVNAGPTENVVDSQNTEVQETQETSSEVAQENSVQSEVAPTKPVQTPEENARFAQVRREAEQRSRDAVIAELGYINPTTGQPITTYSEYQQVLKDQQFKEQHGIDPNEVRPLFEEWKKSDPDFQELNRLKQERILEQQDIALKNDPVKGDLYKQWEADVKAHANALGCDLNTAFLLMLDRKLGDVLTGAKTKAEQAAIEKITTNGASSPGSLSEGGDGTKTFFTKEEVNAMSRAEISKNYEKILESMKKW